MTVRGNAQTRLTCHEAQATLPGVTALLTAPVNEPQYSNTSITGAPSHLEVIVCHTQEGDGSTEVLSA